MTRETLFMKAINEGLDQAMERDERVVLLGEDIAGGVNVEHLENNNEDAWGGVMGITRGLMPKYGRERVIDTPISEHGYLSASVGMALTGLRPVPELMFNDFIDIGGFWVSVSNANYVYQSKTGKWTDARSYLTNMGIAIPCPTLLMLLPVQLLSVLL